MNILQMKYDAQQLSKYTFSLNQAHMFVFMLMFYTYSIDQDKQSRDSVSRMPLDPTPEVISHFVWTRITLENQAS